MIPLEVIVRNVAAGSIVRNYPFREGEVLDPAVIVIDYKSDAHHDPMLNDDLIYALGLATPEELDQIKAMALAVNIVLSEYLAARGITLVDFKLEFGKDVDGMVRLGDEISPDTCRFWDSATGEKLDKDRFRRDMGGAEDAYEEILRRVSSEPGAVA